jgi:hypothetical protein
LGEAVQSETKYTRLGRDRIAYKCLGQDRRALS